MLLILLVWLLAALCTVALGSGAYRLAARLGLAGAEVPPAPEWLSLLGWALLTALLQLWSLWLPIDGRAQLVFGLGSLLIVGLHGRVWLRQLRSAGPRRWSVAHWPGAGLLLLLLGWVLLYAAQVPNNYDTGLYQLQTLRWTEQYAAVPGLGNLHGRLAFNSSLYLALALFRLPTTAGPLYALSSYAYVLLTVAAVRAIGSAEADARRRWAPLLLLLLLLYSYQFWLSSPTTDCTTAAVLALLFCRFATPPATGRTPAELLLLTLLAAWAVTLKLSALPVLLLPLAALLAGRSWPARLKTAAGMLAVALCLIGPWLVRNVVLSGYLVYPLPAVDVLSVDWKVPLAAARTEHYLIVNLARNSAQNIYAPPQQTVAEWLPHWWAPMRGFTGGVVVTALLLAPLVAAWRWRRRWRAAESSWAASWLVAWLGSAFWLVAAPDYRFGAGLLLVAALWPWLGPGWPRLRGLERSFVAGLLLLWAGYNLRDFAAELRHQPARLARRVLWPELPPVPATVPLRVGPGLWVRVPAVGAQCWGAAVPCAPCAEPALRLRGRTLAEGFRRAE